jgi:hypothetical protein
LTRILAFSPYAAWQFHTNYETTLLRACKVRGAEIKVILCDAAFHECDMDSALKNPDGRPAHLCEQCQLLAKRLLDESGLPYEWIGSYLSPQERQEVFDWAQSLKPEEFLTAVFRGFPVAEWVITSVVSFFRNYPIRLDDWRTVNVFRGFLQAAATACIGLEHIFDQFQPDALLLFNGRMSVTRVAFNLARRRGIRVLIHERPLRTGTLFVLENAICTSIVPFKMFWQQWQEVPLTRAQLDRVVEWLQTRRYGLTWGEFRFSSIPLGGEKGRAASGKQPGRRRIVLFTTSTDEFAGDSTMQTPFTSQEDWIMRVVDWAARHPEYDLVIRAHPGLAGQPGIPRAEKQIVWLKELKASLPPNARLIEADSTLSTYDLMDNADLGLTYGSTAGLEMMALGKPIGLVPGFTLYEAVPGIVLFDDPNQVDARMDRLVSLMPSREYQRYAFRCIYRFFFHSMPPFSLVTVKRNYASVLQYESDQALVPGADASLDRVCAYLLENQPIHGEAVPDHVDSAEEDRYFNTLDDSLGWLNNSQLRAKAYGYAQLRAVRRSLTKVDRAFRFARRVMKFIRAPVEG